LSTHTRRVKSTSTQNQVSPNITTPAAWCESLDAHAVKTAGRIDREVRDGRRAPVAADNGQRCPGPIAQRILVFDRVNDVAGTAKSERHLRPVEANARNGRWRDHSEDGDVAHDGPGCVADDDPIIAGDCGL